MTITLLNYNATIDLVTGEGIMSSVTNLPLNVRDIKVSKNLTTLINFQIRDRDRKKNYLPNTTLYLTVSKRDNSALMFRKALILDSSTDATYYVKVVPSDMTGFEQGLYRYSVTVVDSSGAEMPLYMDQGYRMDGVFELTDNAFTPSTAPINVTDFFTFYENWTGNPGAVDSRYDYSSIINGNTFYAPALTNQTFNISLNNFTGSLYVLKSDLINPRANQADWEVDTVVSMTSFTGIQSITIGTQARFIRFALNPTA